MPTHLEVFHVREDLIDVLGDHEWIVCVFSIEILPALVFGLARLSGGSGLDCWALVLDVFRTLVDLDALVVPPILGLFVLELLALLVSCLTRTRGSRRPRRSGAGASRP